MHFTPESVPAFLEHFERVKSDIRAFPGCTGLSLLQDKDTPAILFTYSHWVSEAALQEYRMSELFRDTWAYVRTLFDHRAAAWTVAELQHL